MSPALQQRDVADALSRPMRQLFLRKVSLRPVLPERCTEGAEQLIIIMRFHALHMKTPYPLRP